MLDGKRYSIVDSMFSRCRAMSNHIDMNTDSIYAVVVEQTSRLLKTIGEIEIDDHGLIVIKRTDFQYVFKHMDEGTVEAGAFDSVFDGVEYFMQACPEAADLLWNWYINQNER